MSIGIEWKSEYQRFSHLARAVRVEAEVLLVQEFGERCEDYEPECLCCKRWKALDDLIANPYEEDE